MSMDPLNKKTNGVTMVIDRLPDEILLKILEFLPITEAVATEVLSKRWQYLWTHVFSVNISESPYPGEDIFEAIPIDDETYLERFNTFLTAILVRFVSLKTLRICIAFEDSRIATLGVPYIRNWIDLVINRRVERVELTCFLLKEEPFDLTVLPVKVIRCETLVTLDLFGITIDNFDFPSLPLLKNLRLTDCNFESSACFISLIDACPRLLELVSIETNFDTVQDLTHAQCSNMIFRRLCIARLPRTYCHIPVNGFYNVEELEIELNKVCKNFDPIPLFHNLRKLALSSINSNWSLLLQFFDNCCNLQDLELKEDTGSEKRNFISKGWKDPEVVPPCISFRLNSCTFLRFLGENGEEGCAIYILTHAKALNTMSIHCPKGTILNKGLSLCHKGAACELKIIIDDSDDS